MIATQERSLNIKEMAIFEPGKRPELPFDPQRDISKLQRDKWIANLKQYATYQGKLSYSVLAAQLVLLLPDSKEKLDILPVEELVNESDTCDLIVLYPEKKDGIFMEHGLGSKDFEIHVNNAKKQHRIEQFNKTVWKTVFLWPESIDIMKSDKDLVNNMRGFADGAKQTEDWEQFAWSNANLKLLGYNDLDITKDDWDHMHNLLEIYPNEPVFVSHALNMKLLTAEEIHVTPKGLHLVMPGERKALAEEKLVPIIRRF